MNSKTFTRNQSGAAAVEFALVCIPLFVLIFGVIEFGLLMFNRHVLTNGCREGARAGIVLRIPRLSDAEISDRVNEFCDDHLITFTSTPDALTPEVVRTDADGVPLGTDESGNPILGGNGDLLTVKAAFQYDFAFLTILGLGPVTINGAAAMKME